MERGFSDSGKTTTVDWTRLTETSIMNSLRIATDELNVFGSLLHHVPITPSFLKLDQSAHKNYHLRVKEERKKETEKRRPQKVEYGEKNKFRKKERVGKRNWPSEEQASLFSVFLSRTRVLLEQEFPPCLEQGAKSQF